MLKEVFTSVMTDLADPWTIQAKQIMNYFSTFNIRKTQIKTRLSTLLITKLIKEVLNMVSLSWLPFPTKCLFFYHM